MLENILKELNDAFNIDIPKLIVNVLIAIIVLLVAKLVLYLLSKTTAGIIERSRKLEDSRSTYP